MTHSSGHLVDSWFAPTSHFWAHSSKGMGQPGGGPRFLIELRVSCSTAVSITPPLPHVSGQAVNRARIGIDRSDQRIEASFHLKTELPFPSLLWTGGAKPTYQPINECGLNRPDGLSECCLTSCARPYKWTTRVVESQPQDVAGRVTGYASLE
jgi:hypothetical protein